MNEMPVTPPNATTEEPKKSKVWIWIVGVVALLCCCCVSTFVFYQYLGDPLVKALGF